MTSKHDVEGLAARFQPREPSPFVAGDVVYLGEGVYWTLTRSLAASLNRQRVRRSAALRSHLIGTGNG